MPFSKFKDKLCADVVPSFEQGHLPPFPSSRPSNPSFENPENSVLPVAVVAKGFLLGSEIFFKPGGWEGIAAGLRSPVIRCPGAVSREVKPASLALSHQGIDCGPARLNWLCFSSLGGFRKKSAGAVATFLATYSLQAAEGVSLGADIQAPTPS